MENFAELKSNYLLEIKNVMVMDEIPAQLVINFDQTGLNIVPTSDWTMEAEGSKRVEVIGKMIRDSSQQYWLVHLDRFLAFPDNLSKYNSTLLA